jgi:methylated-DNA-[protein]-cysteine S-methyltransferase
MTAATFYTTIDGPLGELFIQGDGQFVTGLYLPQHKGWKGPGDSWRRSDTDFSGVRAQLAEYFAGERRQFDVSLKLVGTPFQQRVWRELLKIPFGATITYAQLARRLGKPAAVRAVGNANARNPISILVPCHRVIGANGNLTGYAGGLIRKKWLLEREACAALNQTSGEIISPPGQGLPALR